MLYAKTPPNKKKSLGRFMNVSVIKNPTEGNMASQPSMMYDNTIVVSDMYLPRQRLTIKSAHAMIKNMQQIIDVMDCEWAKFSPTPLPAIII